MRATPVATLVVGLLLLPTAARAGVYHPEEPGRPPQLTNFQQFRLRLGELRQVAADPGPGKPSPPTRAAFLEQVDRIRAKEKDGPLSVADRCNLGACYLRLVRPTDAIAALKPVERSSEDPNQFLALSTLATAYQEAGDLDHAEVYLQEALRNWPGVYAHWSPAQLAWYRRCDRLQLTLVRSRRQEARRAPGRPAETLDPLFPGVSYTTGSGSYEPGGMSAESRDALPPDAFLLVMELVRWFPFDNRLYWQYGEILNAEGSIPAAYEVLHELVNARGYSPRELREHRKVLVEASAIAKEMSENGSRNLRRLMCVMAPRGLGLAPGVGAAVTEAGWAATLDPLEQTQAAVASPPPPPAGKLPDWKTVGVSAVFGALAALILRQQFRRPAREAAPAGHGHG